MLKPPDVINDYYIIDIEILILLYIGDITYYIIADIDIIMKKIL